MRRPTSRRVQRYAVPMGTHSRCKKEGGQEKG
jgi:hypothetical protein